MHDLEFAQCCCQGNKAAWDEFVKRYSRLVYSYLIHTIRLKAPQLASKENIQDIFHDFFVLISKDNVQKLKTFPGRNGCSLASWLRQVAVNFAIDFLRRSKHVFSLDEENAQGLSLKDVIPDSSDSALEKLVAGENITHLKDCIGQLNIKEKYFLELSIFRRIKPEKLKNIYKVSRGAIDMRKARLIEQLKECFRRKGIIG
jgi:RNA polymerase sigma factor (sigma-70 family)